MSDALFEAMGDPRLWDAAVAMNGLVAEAVSSGCDCAPCIMLRAISGYLDELHEQHKDVA